jgi:23S rRNA pseudouridine1911/1915/1917 synthase
VAARSQWTVAAEDEGVRLDRFLAAPARLGSRGRVSTALERGQIFLNDAEASPKDAGARVRIGDVVRVWLDRPGSRKRRSGFTAHGLQILYEDEVLLVVNKPAGLLTVPLGRKGATSAFDLVSDHLGPRGRRAPFVVHRIDRDTSGIVVFAKTAAAQQAVKDQFARKEPERVYWAVVHGRPQPARGRWRDHLAWDEEAVKQTSTHASNPRAAEAISDYRVLETFADAALIEVRLHTGKRNQIRIQAALRGHALVGERQYANGPSGRTGPTRTGPAHSRQALHAHRLSFAHPIDGRPLTFEAPLPQDLADLLTRLRAHDGQRGGI